MGSSANAEEELRKAATNGDVADVKRVLETGVDVNAFDEDGMTALHLASSAGHVDVVRVLLDHGADLNIASESDSMFTVVQEGETALHLACRDGHVSVVRELMSRGADPSTSTGGGESALHIAAREGRADVVHELLKHGVDPNLTAETSNLFDGLARGELALHVAALAGRGEVVKVLVANGADLNAVNHEGWTALHFAAHCDKSEPMKELLALGADPNSTTKIGESALCIATTMGHFDTAKELLMYHVDPNRVTKDGWTSFHHACHWGHVEIVREMLDHGGDVNGVEKEGWTPLHFAVRRGHVELFRDLLSRGGSVSAVDQDGLSVVHIACGSGRVELLKELAKHGADLNKPAQTGDSPLHLASQNHHVDTVQYLLDQGCSVHVTNKAGKTPLSLSLQWRPDTHDFYAVLETVCALMSSGAVYVDSTENYPSVRKMYEEDIATIPICVQHWSTEQQRGKKPVTRVPSEVFERGPTAVETYLREIDASDEDALILRRKVCVVGSSKTGKTSLVKSITSMNPTLVDEDDRTIGIDLFHLEFPEELTSDTSDRTKKNHSITFWDFAGQEEYHVAHTLFFSRRTLYLLCVDVSAFGQVFDKSQDCEDEDEAESMIDAFVKERVWRWFRLIFARQPEAEFVLIGTKADAFENDAGRLKEIEGEVFRVLDEYKVAFKSEMQREMEALRAKSAEEDGPSDQDEGRIANLKRLQVQLEDSLPSSWSTLNVCDVGSIEHARSAIENAVTKSNRSFLMPDKYSRVLDKVKELRMEKPHQSTKNRIKQCFVSLTDLRRTLQSDMDDLTDEECDTILETLHDLGDLLWYARDGLQVLGDTVILDAEFLIDFIRQIVCHDPSKISKSGSRGDDEMDQLLEDMLRHGKVAHDLVCTFTLWKRLMYPDQMLHLKQLLQHFQLAYPANGSKMEADSDLIVPSYWRVRDHHVDLDVLESLSTKLKSESVVTHYHWEYDFHFEMVEAVFEQLAVRSYDVFEDREIQGHCIESTPNGDFVVRLALGTRGHDSQQRQLIRLEVVATEKVVASELLREVHAAVEAVLCGYPGLYVSRSAVVNGKRHRIDQAIKKLRDATPAMASVLQRQYSWLPQGVGAWFLRQDMSAKVAPTPPSVPAMEKMTSMYNRQKSMAIKMEAVLEQNRTMRTALESKMDNTRETMLNLHAGAGNHRDIPALWMVERVVKPKSKLILWILSEISGRCFHRPIEIEISPRFLAAHGEHLQTGLSVFANAVPDTIPLLGAIILGAVDVLKTKTEQAIRVHNMADNLQLGDSGRLQSNENRKLPPAESYALLQSILREYDEQLSPHSISTLTGLECATLEDGSYQWAHREEHTSRKNRLRIDYVKASVAQNPTTDTTTTTFEATSVSIVTHPTKFYLCDFVIRGLSSKTDGRLVYCSWELVDLKQSRSLDTGETIQNPHEDPLQQSLWLQAYPLTVDSVTQFRDCKLVVTLKRPSRLSLRSDRVVGSGSINLSDVVETLTEQQFASGRVEVPLTGLKTSIQCQLRAFGN
ncbi:hypothetical protein Poli38472_001877 [Pythium oligandrum]|uniref:COR domain-containing protein n=1 Tax=Pythium oligandrum TaxID=41045 RepID=A0A8K1FNT0_PYTOL|nr:hypothetical protein Poli38472_001877 [Pythium oligandrum]|eukprot:TMW69721.1 hypothetical protein Poli38472_001877 [Pythium oligandrum]